MAFDWENFIDLVASGTVVPIIGNDLLQVGSCDGGMNLPFADLLNQGLARQLGLTDNADVSRIVAAELKGGRPRLEITRALAVTHQELNAMVQVPETLRKLAQITDFPLYLTTTTSTLPSRAIEEERGMQARVLASTVNQTADLPPHWQIDPTPAVFHLFGKISAAPGYALTEEDMLEFLHRLHDRELRPQRLFDVLRTRHLLFLGNSFPDWLTRILYRVLRGRRVIEGGDTLEAFADSGVHGARDAPLVAFLRDFAPGALLYEEGSAAEFVDELHRRWSSARGPDRDVEVRGDYEVEDMEPGSVFISFRGLDKKCAENVADALQRGGLSVWFDSQRLETGDPFEAKVRRHIQRCDLFVPLISRNTERADASFFHREWQWALRRADAMHGRPFVMPVTVHDLPQGHLQGVPEEFLVLRAAHAPGGMLPTTEVEQFIASIRNLRARRAS